MTSNVGSPTGKTEQPPHPARRFQSTGATDEDSDDTTDRYAAAAAIAETLSTTFGPKGLDKMLIDRSGTVIVTNTGATVLDGLEMGSPTGRVVRNAVATQATRIGDGSTTMALLVGELLTTARDLTESGLHPTAVIRGYLTAGRHATEHVTEVSAPVSREETDQLTQIATTAITGRWDEMAATALASIAVEALERVDFDSARLTLHAYSGGGVTDAEHINGILIDTNNSSTDSDGGHRRGRSEQPHRIPAPTIALVEQEITQSELSKPATVSVSDVDALDEIRSREHQRCDERLNSIIAADVDVVICQQAIDAELRTALARRGVVSLARTRQDEFDAIARATGADTVVDVGTLDSEKVGTADVVRQRTIGSTPVVEFTGLPNEHHASVVVRGGTEHVAEETRRIVADCIQNLRQTVHGGGSVPGGGATWMSASNHVTEYTRAIDDRSQLACKAFADALRVVPRTLARNAGADPLTTLSTLSTRHETGDTGTGVSPTGTVQDMTALGVIEPAAVVSGCISAAVETATLVVRIDDVLDADGSGSATEAAQGQAHEHSHAGDDGHSGYPWALGH